MPVFNLELHFDDKGALSAVKHINNVSNAATGATNAMDKLEESTSEASDSMEELGASTSDGAKKLDDIADAADDASEAVENLGNTSRKTRHDLSSIGDKSNVNRLNEVTDSIDGVSKVIDNLNRKTTGTSNPLRNVGKESSTVVDQVDKVTDSVDKAGDSVAGMGDEVAKTNNTIRKFGKDNSDVFDRISVKAKSLVKDIVALAAAYASIRSAMSFINRGLEFNASLEQSQIGIASLITSMVKLEDAQGKVLEGAEKYRAAQGMAAELMKEIQVLGLKTTADAQSIIEGFQSILAPALQAGFELNKIPAFAVQAAQAMQTLGIPLNQMRTELDALLTGNVNLAQDILAPKLFADVQGNLKEYVQSLKEAGKLEQEITRRLEPYNLALKDTENTWAAISSNLGEAVDKLAGDTSLNYTKAMKQSLSEINDLIINTKTGEISESFKNIASQLAEIQDWIGNKILASTETLVSLIKGINSFLGTDFGKGALSSFAEAVKLAAGALAGFATARALAFGKDFVVDKIKAATSAISQYRNKVVEAANSQLEAAIAERNRQQAFMATTRAQQAAAASEKTREAQLARLTMLTNQVAAAERNLAAATTLSARSLENMASAGFGKLVNLVGGPFNASLMAIGAATAYLSSMQSNAEKAADLHASALQRLSEVQKAATESGKKLSEQLNETAEATRRIAINEEVEALGKLRTELLSFNFRSETFFLSDFSGDAKKLDDLRAQLLRGKGTFEEFEKELSRVYTELDKAGEASSRLGQAITRALERVAKPGRESETAIKELRGELEATAETAGTTATVVEETANSYEKFKNAVDAANDSGAASIKTDEDAVKWLKKRYEATETGRKALEEDAKTTDEVAFAKLNLALSEMKLAAAAAEATASLDTATQAQIDEAERLKQAVLDMEAFIAKTQSAQSEFGQSGKKTSAPRASSGGSRSADNSAEKWKELTQQLTQLEGKATSASQSLDKTLASIEETGKAAGKSAKEIQEMQQAFVAASDKNALQELNKELLQLEGNTKRLQDIERQEKTDQLRAKINDIRSLKDDERKILLGRVESAVQQEFKVKDLQTAVSFMQDLESLGGEYGQSLELQNQLIEHQAALYRDNLGPGMAEYVDEWERLKKLSNDNSFMGGAIRGLKKFGADYGDISKQVEQFTTQMGSHISNTLADAFMKGKFSAEDFFSSLISMAAQAATNAFIGQIFSGVASIAGSFFGSTSYNGLNSKAATGAAATSGYSGMGQRWSGGSAHGNVFSGGNLSDFSNSIVSRPTFFGFDTHFSRYARGAGLMGEAGPEAIMPLSRTKSGDLGVQMVGGWASTPIVNVNVVNESGSPVDAQTQATPNGSGGFDLEIIIAQVEQGLVSRAKQGKSQLMHYQEAAYGMNRAPVLARGRSRA